MVTSNLVTAHRVNLSEAFPETPGVPLRRDIVHDHTTPPDRLRPPIDDPAGAGDFFVEPLTLKAGVYTLRAQVMGPLILPAGAVLSIAVREVVEPQTELARLDHIIAQGCAPAMDNLFLSFSVAETTPLTVSFSVSKQVAMFRARALTIQRGSEARTLDWTTTHGTHETWPMTSIRNVTIANSGLCPASCVHCPTNKSWLDVPRPGVMSDTVFESLVDGLVATGLPITGCVGFGLFGDPFTDRDLAPRIRRLRDAVPAVPITISTPVATYGPRQAEAVEAADSVAVHVESIDPAIYDRIMTPLTLAKVKPRIEALVADAGTKAVLAVPVHRANIDGVPALEAWWSGLGGGAVVYQAFSNRLNASKPISKLHLSAHGGACTQDLAYDLVVDWDGKLLTCCSDFQRQGGLGSLADTPLPQLIADERRRFLFERLRGRQWNEIGLCRSCAFDEAGSAAQHVAAVRQQMAG